MCSWWYRGRHRTGDLTVDDLILRAAQDAPDPWVGLLAVVDFQASTGHRLADGGCTVAELQAAHVFLDAPSVHPWVTWRPKSWAPIVDPSPWSLSSAPPWNPGNVTLPPGGRVGVEIEGVVHVYDLPLDNAAQADHFRRLNDAIEQVRELALEDL